MTIAKSITKDAINGLPLAHYDGEAIIIETDAGAARAIAELNLETMVGFDTETRPSFSKGESYKVALLQLSSLKRAYLFRLSKITFTQDLADLLANPGILKIGVAVHDDIKALQKLHPFKAEGFLDLNVIAEKQGFQNLGLRSLSALFLNVRLSKAAKLTNWDQPELTRAQVHYAANDALVGLKIYQKMQELNLPL